MKILIAENLTMLANFFGACAAYMLSNHMVRIGRFVGFCGASTWLVYGIVFMKWDSIIASLIVLVIYVQAILKFEQKQRLYKQMIKDRTKDKYGLELQVEELQSKVIELQTSLTKSEKIRLRFHRMKKKKKFPFKD